MSGSPSNPSVSDPGHAPVRGQPGVDATAPRLPELLAPAGDWECAKAAVENGADAIYFGLERFNARMRAHNFTEADLPRLMEFLHGRGVKGYVTFNTLVFENEMREAEQYARSIVTAGVDAAIVQDVGICRLIRQLSPDFPIHVSTQMTVTSAGGIEFARELGCNLVVLARECSLKEIESIRTVPGPASLPLEVFVHGALCVAYSGQCLTSEALGGRSANRGECAQACRMPYELVSDGQIVPLGGRKYLLSPQDLAGLELLPELARLGVASLKIEGRLKTAEYVASITRIYRSALDQLGGTKEGLVTSAAAVQAGPGSKPQPPLYEMEMAFSRGLYTGWFRGTNNQALVHGQFGKKRGVYLGEVAEVRHQGVVVRLKGPLKAGDGVVFDAGRPEEKEEGGRVYEIKSCAPGNARADRSEPTSGKQRSGSNGTVLLTFGRGDIDLRRIQKGNKLWKTSDPELQRQLRKSFEGDKPRFQRAISLDVHGRKGQCLTVIARDEHDHVVRADSEMPLAAAESQPLTSERMRGQLGRLGGTSYRLEQLKSFVEGQVLLPLSELNRIRRQIVSDLDSLRSRPLRWTLNDSAVPKAGEQLASFNSKAAAAMQGTPRLIVLVRNLDQMRAALSSGVRTVYCDFENPKKYRDAVEIVGSLRKEERAGAGDPLEVWVAPPRIFKMGEEWTLQQVRSCNADGYLVRNYDHLQFFADQRRIGDYSLNVANRLSADYFRNRYGLERVTASYDLNFSQLEALLSAAPAGWFEVTIHQHMPMFHMEHCIFCAFLSTGTDYRNCGRPCDQHDVQLRDRIGARHPVKADVGCRNTVFNALAQTGAEYTERLLALGVRTFRVEFLNESPDLVRQTIGKYRQLLRGEISGAQLWRELKLFNQLGVTRGQMAGPGG